MLSRSTVYAKSFVSAWQSAPATEQGQLVESFFRQLEADRMMPLAREIIAAVERELQEGERGRQVIAEVAHGSVIPKEEFEKIGVTRTAVNPELVGGFRTTRRGRIEDATVSGSLAQIRRALSQE